VLVRPVVGSAIAAGIAEGECCAASEAAGQDHKGVTRRDFLLGTSFTLAAPRLASAVETVPIPRITTTRGVDEASFWKIGGIDQWVQIRGEDRDNPVILCLNGGPGATWIPWTELFVPWEKAFTVVLWDQRGEGKTQIRSGDAHFESYTLQRMQQDGIELARLLTRHLRKRRVILLGHSSGAILGMRMLRAQPHLFAAYVGTGQIVDRQQGFSIMYDYLMAKARAVDDHSAISTLETLGRGPYPPDIYKDAAKVAVHDAVWNKFQPQSDIAAIASINSVVGRYLKQFPDFRFGNSMVSNRQLKDAIMATTPQTLGLRFEMPVFFFQGKEDLIAPQALTWAYLEQLRAPKKEMVEFQAGHFAWINEPERFLDGLVSRVRPLAT
jgi:pimeloyl-ACP methyl ester carboxylesterase